MGMIEKNVPARISLAPWKESAVWSRRSVLLLFFSGTAFSHAQEEKYCRVCGRRIEAGEPFFAVPDRTEAICARCNQAAPRCRFCKLPTAAQAIHPYSGACPSCEAQLIHCQACGRAILGIRYSFALREGFFCPACKRNRPACFLCGAPVGDDLWRYPDDRVVCGACGERAIFDIDDIARIMEEAGAIVQSSYGLALSTAYVLRVEKLNSASATTRELRDRIFSDRSPLFGKELGLYRRVGTLSEIYLLFGLIPELLYEAAGHEYAHAWQADHNLLDAHPEWVEGFAQWAAAEVLRQKGFTAALERLERRGDSPYGTGYRQMKRLYRGNIRDLLPR